MKVIIYEKDIVTQTIAIGQSRGESAYEIAKRLNPSVGTEQQWNDAVNANRILSEEARDQAVQARGESVNAAQSAGNSAQTATEKSEIAVSAKNTIESLFEEFGVTLDSAINGGQ